MPQVWSVEPRDLTISDRLVLQLPAQAAARSDEASRVILAAEWLPDSDTWVAVTTPLSVYLFDLTHSAEQPAVVIEPQGHVLLSGKAAFVPSLVPQQQQQGEVGGEAESGQLRQQLYALLLTRDGQLLSAEVPLQLLERQQACSSHWPHSSCKAAGASSSSSGGPSGSSSGAQGTSRSNTPGPHTAAAAGAGSSNASAAEVRPSSRGAEAGSWSMQEGGMAGPSSSGSSGGRCVRLAAEAVEWPQQCLQLQVGRSCHWLQGNQLLLVAGMGKAAHAAGGADSSSTAPDEQQHVQLLLQLDVTCGSVTHCSRWHTADAAVPIFGSPKPLVLSEAATYWDLPLLPAGRASYGAAQLFAVAPGQAKQLLQGATSSAANGLGCAYITGLIPSAASNSSSSSDTTSTSTGTLQAVVQPLHLKHSAAGAVVDGIAVLSFPYTQQLLLVVLCSKGNMYMYASRRPPGLLPMQPFTQLLRRQLTQGPGKPPAAAGAADATPADSSQDAAGAARTAAAAGSSDRGLSKRAAAVALATGSLPAAARQAAVQGAAQTPAVVPADASTLLLQYSQNITSHLSISGDISRAGTAEAAARALFKTPADPERRLEAPNAGAAMTLVVKVAAACELQPVGIKLLLPGGGAAPGNVKLTFGDGSSSSGGGAAAAGRSSGGGSGGARPNSIAAIAAAARTAARAAAGAGASAGSGSNTRTVPLAAGTDSSGRSRGRNQRWHQIILTPEESVVAAAAGQVTLEFGPAVEPEKRAALCHMDMFGQAADVVAARAKQRPEEEEEQVGWGWWVGWWVGGGGRGWVGWGLGVGGAARAKRRQEQEEEEQVGWGSWVGLVCWWVD